MGAQQDAAEGAGAVAFGGVLAADDELLAGPELDLSMPTCDAGWAVMDREHAAPASLPRPSG